MASLSVTFKCLARTDCRIPSYIMCTRLDLEWTILHVIALMMGPKISSVSIMLLHVMGQFDSNFMSMLSKKVWVVGYPMVLYCFRYFLPVCNVV